MSNARNRANQLHAQALRPRRVTDRVVGVPMTAATHVHPDDDYVRTCNACGYHVCSCTRYVPMRAYEQRVERAPQPAAKPSELAGEGQLAAGWSYDEKW